jgi:hypothetical protein
MKRGGEDSILFKRLCARFPRIVASFVFPDGNAIKPAAEIYAPMEETLFQPPKVSGLSAGSDDQQITINWATTAASSNVKVAFGQKS